MASRLSIDGGLTYIELKDMTDEQVHSAISEIEFIGSMDDAVREMLDSIDAANGRERLSALLDLGDISIECNEGHR